MTDFLHFFLAAKDQNRIKPGTIQVTDDFVNSTHVTRIDFTIEDPEEGAPQIRFLWPGRIDFQPDPNSPGQLYAPDETHFTEADYQKWKRVGTIRVKAQPFRIRLIKDMGVGLAVVPNIIWYFPLTLSQEFLFTTIREKLKHHIKDHFGITIIKTSGKYAAHAVSYFLSGKYGPIVRDAHRTDPEYHWPTVTMNKENGNVTLFVATAQGRRLYQDGNVAAKDEHGNIRSVSGAFPNKEPNQTYKKGFATLIDDKVSEVSRDHPVNGTIPVRDVLRKLKENMLHVYDQNNAMLPLAQRMLSEENNERFVRIHFRRTWKNIPNYSFYFPFHETQIDDNETDQLLLRSRIPHHGVVYFKPLGQTTNGYLNINVSIIGGMYCLKGDDDTQPLWQERTNSTYLDYTFNINGPYPAIILRRPMSEEIFTEKAKYGAGAACTYHSMRRTLRALANNRIVGGRLNYKDPRNKSEKAEEAPYKDETSTYYRLIQALGSSAKNIKGDKPKQEIDGEPGPIIAERVDTLKHVWEAFFEEGPVPYNLWQSAAANWYKADGSVQDDYLLAAEYFARGGAGAVSYLGIAHLHNDPRPFQDADHPGESLDSYVADMSDIILEGLQPGAILQWWLRHEGFEILKERRGVFYKITDRSLENLKSDGVADTVLNKLEENMKNQEFKGQEAKEEFLETLRAVLGDEQVKRYWGKIFQYARLLVGHSPIFKEYIKDSDGNIIGMLVLDQTGEDGVKVIRQPNDRLKWHHRQPDLWIGANWDE